MTSRSKTLAPRIARILDSYRISTARDARERVTKAAEHGNPESHLDRLARLLGSSRRIVALEQGRRSLKITGAPDVRATDFLDMPTVRTLLDQAEGRAADILQESKAQIEAIVQRVLREAAAAKPRPTDSETARRLRAELARLSDMTFERAIRIARTEMGVAANTGLVAGYEAAGVDELEWLAYKDGRSGDRHHERMHGKRVVLGEFFTLPSGAKLRWPLDPTGPVGEVVNCRCTVRARRTK